MKSNHPQIDGFVPRRSTRSIGGALHDSDAPQPQLGVPGTFQQQKRPEVGLRQQMTHNPPGAARTSAKGTLGQPAAGGIRRSDVDQSLREIDQQSQDDQRPRKRGNFRSRRRFIVRTLVGVLVAGAVAAAAGRW